MPLGESGTRSVADHVVNDKVDAILGLQRIRVSAVAIFVERFAAYIATSAVRMYLYVSTGNAKS